MVVVIAVNVAWRVTRYALGFPIWGDEAFVAINLVSRGLLELAAPLEHYQIVPVGFLWVEWLVIRLLGDSELALRLVPFLAGIVSVPLFARLARRALAPYGALLAVAILAASYYPVRHATEVKPYSIDLLASLVLLSLAWPLLRRSADLPRWILFGLVAAALVWMSYPSVFIAGGVLLVLGIDALCRRTGRALIGAIAAGSLLAGSFLAMYVLVGAPQAASAPENILVESQTWSFTFPPLSEPWRLPLWFLDVHTGNMLAYPTGGNRGGSAATFVLCVIGGVVLWRLRRRDLLLLLSPLPLMFVAAAMEKYPYGGSARVAQHLVPMVCILAGGGLAAALGWRAGPDAADRRVQIACMVFVLFALAGIARDIAKPYKKLADLASKRLTIDLAAHSPPDARWIVFGAVGDVPHVPNLLDWGGSAARFRLNIHRYVDGPVLWGPTPEAVAALDSRPTWLIVYEDNRVAFPRAQFEAYLVVLRDRFGEPEREEHSLGDRKEAMTIYRYD
ncbi:MAG: glycosyltransferase family 39 protein [Planctomycetota bacterium]|jgi:hypothetical protein